METTAVEPQEHEDEIMDQEQEVEEIEEIEEAAAPAGLARKTHYTGKVLKTTIAGAVVDIGQELPGVVHISQLSKEPVNRVEDVVQVGQMVDVWVRRVSPDQKRIELTMIKPLGLEWREIEPGLVVTGKVTRLEKFGAFVDIGAERPGLVHISELAHGYVKDPTEIVHEGDEVKVQVLKVSRRKRQIKLSMKALVEAPPPVEKPARRERNPRFEPKQEVVEMPKDEEPPVPTALEFALREAMEKKTRDSGPMANKPRRKAGRADQELESMLARTLENKLRTAK